MSADPREIPGSPRFGSPPAWQAVRLVARREFLERLRDRGFAVSSAITLLIIAAVIILPAVLGGDDDGHEVAFTGPRADAMSRAASEEAQRADVEVLPRPVADERSGRQRVADGDLDAAVTGDRVIVKDELDTELASVLQAAHTRVESEARLAARGIDAAAVREAYAVPPLPTDALDPPDEDADVRRFIAFVGVFLLYGQLIGYGFWVASGVTEEKSSRVVELLLSTISPRALLGGKVIGIGLLGLLQLCLIAVAGLTLATAMGRVQLTSTVLTPVGVVVAWFVLGYAFYSCLFAAAAARVSRQEELQNTLTPLSMALIVSMFTAFYALNEPEAAISRVLAFVPPFSALVQPIRTVVGETAPWEAAVAILLMVAATAGLVVAGARLYEGAVLRMGAKVTWGEAWRAHRSGEAH